MNASFFKQLKTIKKGKKIYKRLLKECKNKHIYIAQHPGLGDAFLTGVCIKNCCEENDVLIITPGYGSREVYEYLGFINVVVMPYIDVNSLIKFCQFYWNDINSVTILHHQALVWNTGILWNMQGYNKLNFKDLIVCSVFPDLLNKKISIDAENINRSGISLIKKYNLEVGNTVIFFPYSNTLKKPLVSIWESIVFQKKSEGYKLATYVYGEEQALNNTVEVRCSISELVDFVEHAGFVIGTRSGIIDIIASAKCSKTIFYPKVGGEGWIHGSILDYWSVNAFGYCEDAIEIEV